MKTFKEIRLELGLSQEEFARKLGITRPYVSLIESGKKEIGNKLKKRLEIISKSNGYEFTDSNNQPSAAEFAALKAKVELLEIDIQLIKHHLKC